MPCKDKRSPVISYPKKKTYNTRNNSSEIPGSSVMPLGSDFELRYNTKQSLKNKYCYKQTLVSADFIYEL